MIPGNHCTAHRCGRTAPGLYAYNPTDLRNVVPPWPFQERAQRLLPAFLRGTKPRCSNRSERLHHCAVVDTLVGWRSLAPSTLANAGMKASGFIGNIRSTASAAVAHRPRVAEYIGDLSTIPDLPRLSVLHTDEADLCCISASSMDIYTGACRGAPISAETWG
jgi:hypothetical protein